MSCNEFHFYLRHFTKITIQDQNADFQLLCVILCERFLTSFVGVLTWVEGPLVGERGMFNLTKSIYQKKHFPFVTGKKIVHAKLILI